MAPAHMIARSAMIHSGRFSETKATRSPRPIPTISLGPQERLLSAPVRLFKEHRRKTAPAVVIHISPGPASPPLYGFRPAGGIAGRCIAVEISADFAGLSKSACLERHPDGRPASRSPDHEGALAMQYMLLIYGDERATESVPREEMAGIIDAYTTYSQALRDAKVLVASNRLRPTATATAVRIKDGQTNVLDGPFAETKEQLGGYYLIEVPDLDAALSWAGRCPGARHGTVEVRPIWVM